MDIQYSVVKCDIESLIEYDPELSLEGEMSTFTQERLKDQDDGDDGEIWHEFDVEDLIEYDPEGDDGVVTSSLTQEYLQDPDYEDMCDDFDAENLIVYDPEELETDFVVHDSSISVNESVPDDLEGSTTALVPVNIDDTLDLVDEYEESSGASHTVFKGRARPGRKRKVETQTREDRKRLLNNNKTHINSKGNVHEEKVFDPNFECQCRHNCTNLVPLATRRRCFTQFWGAGTFTARAFFLITCLRQLPDQRGKEGEVVKRNDREYAIYGTTVCQKAILGTLQIDECRFETAIQKYMEEETVKDNRGKKSGGWNALPPAKAAEVRAHIASFPKYESHYTRGKTDSKFLSANLNLSKIYELYKAKVEKPASLSFYKNIFYTQFDLKFKPPKKDTCYTCDKYAANKKDKVGVELEKEEKLHKAHIMQAESLQAQMKADCAAAKTDNELETLTFDMQKTLPIPKLSTSIAYYKRQLNLYNLGIHSGSNGKGTFNLWLETEASKGTQEVGSCLKQYIDRIEKPLKKLILWSDSCGGQNRSIKLVLMMMFILENHATLETISMRYLLSGHSFLPNDTEFASAETALKQHDNLYTDVEYMKVMKECRIKNKFDVNRMSPDAFFSVKMLESLITNRKVDVNKDKVSWLNTHEIVIYKNQPGILYMKEEIGGAYQMVNIQKIRQRLNFGNVVLDSLWPVGKPLSSEKIKDLQDMLKVVPSEHQQFYEFLNTVEAADFVDDIDGLGDMVDFDLEFENYPIEG